MFTKTNQTHCFIPSPAISPDSSFTCTAETANGKETWEHELETHQHNQVWKWLLGTKNSQISCARIVFPTHPGLIQLLVMCICQDCPRFFTGLSKRLISSQSSARVDGFGGEETHPQQYELSSAWVRSTKPGVTVPAGPPLWYSRARWFCRKIKKKQQIVEWMKLSNRWRKEGAMENIPYEVIHRWSCPHSWVLFKCTADQSWFVAALQ